MIVTNHRKYAHVTPILKRLQWLPLKYCCMFKTATLVFIFLQSCSGYFGPSCPLAAAPTVPSVVTLTVNT